MGSLNMVSVSEQQSELLDIPLWMISQELMEEEKEAFRICESDRMKGLTWLEVEKCEMRFGDKLLQKGIPLPTEDDFNNADLDCDGILHFAEWEESVTREISKNC